MHQYSVKDTWKRSLQACIDISSTTVVFFFFGNMRNDCWLGLKLAKRLKASECMNHIAYRTLENVDAQELRVLHEQWFPIRYTDVGDVFNV